MLTSGVTDGGVDDHAVASSSLQRVSMYYVRDPKFLIRFLPFPSVTFSLFIMADRALQNGQSVRRAIERYALRTLGRFSTVVLSRSQEKRVPFKGQLHHIIYPVTEGEEVKGFWTVCTVQRKEEL